MVLRNEGSTEERVVPAKESAYLKRDMSHVMPTRTMAIKNTLESSKRILREKTGKKIWLP